MNFASWNQSTITNATFVMDQTFPRDYLYSSSEKLNNLAYIMFGSVLLFACLFIKEQKVRGYSIDLSVTVATTLMAGLIVNFLCQLFWTSKIALQAILIIPIAVGLVSGVLFVKQFMLVGHFFKSLLVLVCFMDCAFYLSYEQPGFMWAYSILLFVFALVMMFTCFKRNKMEWMMSCAYSIQGWRLICSTILPNTLYGSLRTLQIQKVFESNQMSMASWIFAFLVPSFALFRIMMIESNQRLVPSKNLSVGPDTFAETLIDSTKQKGTLEDDDDDN